MWNRIRQLLSGSDGRQSAQICLGRPEAAASELIVHIPLGIGTEDVPAADARLLRVESPERLRAVLAYARRRQLPVASWVLTGVWHMPARCDRLARWLQQLAGEADGAILFVDTTSMPPAFRRRLVGHLRRLGCEVD